MAAAVNEASEPGGFPSLGQVGKVAAQMTAIPLLSWAAKKISSSPVVDRVCNCATKCQMAFNVLSPVVDAYKALRANEYRLAKNLMISAVETGITFGLPVYWGLGFFGSLGVMGATAGGFLLLRHTPGIKKIFG